MTTLVQPVSPQTEMKYMVVYPVVNSDILDHYNSVYSAVESFASERVDLFKPREPHITLCPPFYTSYETATRINLNLSFSALGRLDTELFLGELAFFEDNTDGYDVLYFSVQIDRRVIDHLIALREDLHKRTDVRFIGKWLSREPRLHITIGRARGLSRIPQMAAYMTKYNSNHRKIAARIGPQRIGALVSCMYAKYPDGWRHLSENQEQTL